MLSKGAPVSVSVAFLLQNDPKDLLCVFECTGVFFCARAVLFVGSYTLRHEEPESISTSI